VSHPDSKRPPLLLSIPGACEALGGLGRTTLWQLAKDGELTQVKIGRRSFITVKSIEAYVNRLSGDGA
jgi:predicted DNA-binding transcriptional regulator AlpA